MRKLHSLAALAALTLTVPALAQDRGVPGIDVDVNANLDMGSVDKNSDGKVSRSEAAGNQDLQKQFNKLDANKDGTLDQGEFAKFEAKGQAKTGKGDKEGSAKGERGEPSNTNDTPGTTDDSTPGNPDQLGPGR